MKTIFKYIPGRFLGLVVATLMISTAVNAQYADFSGTWKLNAEKSEYPGLSLANLFDVMIIKQADKHMTVGTLTGDKQKTATLNLDGSEVKSKLENPVRDRTTYFRWLSERSYEVRSIDNAGTAVYSTVSTTTLSDDGKMLTINSTADYKSYGIFKMVLIAEKQ